MKKHEILELEIKGLGPAGQGLAQHKDWQVLVPYAQPGQKVAARILKRRQKKAEARLTEVLETRPDQIKPACAHFGQPPTEAGTGCGGCIWQSASYALQLEWKHQIVTQLLSPLLGPEMQIQPVLPSPQIWGYRNKFELSFGDKIYLSDENYQRFRAAGEPLPRGSYLGFHVPGSFGTLVDITSCQLMPEPLRKLHQLVREVLPALGGEVYSPRFHTGYWRHLVLRHGVRSGDLMLHLNTAAGHAPDWSLLLEKLASFEFPGTQIRSVLHSEHTGDAQIVGYQPVTVLQGEALIQDSLCGLDFEISPYAFFQTNTQAAEVLYTQIQKMAAQVQARTIYDLYSGTGTIGMVLSGQAEQVFGIEEIESAVADAKKNAARNQIQNCHFQAGKVEHLLPELIEKHPADLVIIDPPRAGLHPKALKTLLQLQAPALIYVSCNPAALARDLETLLPLYQVEAIQPVDLFPQTGHIETILSLRLKNP
ncbi:23S rRNA (uracil(1939)-C(5))-methyltransferase RlmD [bacterium (Candidatus Blackallbacteria) CG17_big_fil_post_rev_8_21_14_2_50_48_46]|uniref:23S rRNA (Uracil(1939)-C(5))-methyltransferase RlmD n=1 Tax=bacterium (Candidatus Blackallbacteria) CG17_big_fil_post_rev_8_21_14_2_50_48_46 TaxID=2014261 RepID=A0A2M7G637_9BACT|nr:MAG: 23S rRNA (uracil(1939)-C(5))-methyltransferase RlmD [bacterium (Candidatus Blackallbacteria) CG18_big_fil_WC_8_21_14_2_50_49_26]PIW17055.1 MAG: 23S rRNA (uracil(1939)-C(5))-methyltransferase RlmD [bacterium (Candidatus Blackallbacteria) CG17_big_fil_post_rev_8_21_14_2_50_48_46]PIW47710.1 MAG: 23S rRNA (uracil(1939)-C(5))-methyltransferase RlmD [bacterium (Candidatus Blackallbacteria) CG13_big_fil_rev_8_21_14_2_50_49_14]